MQKKTVHDLEEEKKTVLCTFYSLNFQLNWFSRYFIFCIPLWIHLFAIHTFSHKNALPNSADVKTAIYVSIYLFIRCHLFTLRRYANNEQTIYFMAHFSKYFSKRDDVNINMMIIDPFPMNIINDMLYYEYFNTKIREHHNIALLGCHCWMLCYARSTI